MADVVRPQSLADRNSFGFLRWLFAALVVLAHSADLGGFDPKNDPMVRWSIGHMSFGTFAVLGFFAISGYVVTLSWMRTGSVVRFAWKRFLRIAPGYWACLIVMVVVIGPLAWWHQYGHLAGYSAARPGATSFVVKNVLLVQRQPTIGTLFAHTPRGLAVGAGEFNGSVWTLPYEVLCYALLAGVAVVGMRRRPVFVAAGLAVFSWAAAIWTYLSPGDPAPFLPAPQAWVFVAIFFTAALTALVTDIERFVLRIGPASGVVLLVGLHTSAWWFLSAAMVVPFVLWLGHALPLRSFDKHGDLSYGTYIYAFPLQMLAAAYGLHRLGFAGFVAVSLAASSVAAYLSWNIVEKRAIRLKSWRWRGSAGSATTAE